MGGFLVLGLPGGRSGSYIHRMPLMPITVRFDETTLPPLLDSLVRAERSLAATHELFDGMYPFRDVAEDFAAARAAVETIRMMIDDAVLRAAVESN